MLTKVLSWSQTLNYKQLYLEISVIGFKEKTLVLKLAQTMARYVFIVINASLELLQK